jgi:cyanophycin synthetase
VLTIHQTKVFRGPSLWGPVPVILLEVSIGELEVRLSRETPLFFERLSALVPSLRDDGDLVNRPEGGLRRLLLDRLALALQQVAAAQGAQEQAVWTGDTLAYAETFPTAQAGYYRVAYAYEYAALGEAAGTLAVRLLNHLLYDTEPEFDFDSELTTLVEVTKQLAYRGTTAVIVAAAKQRGIPVECIRPHAGIDGDIVQLGHGRYQRRVLWGSITSQTPLLADTIATDKRLTARLLQEAGLPTAQNSVVHTADEAVEAATVLDYPVVLKPLNGAHGRGVVINLPDEVAVREAFPLARAKSHSGQVVVETFIPGKDYRILVIANQVVAVAERVPAHVIGDGRHTVAQLIEIANADPRRGVDHEKILTCITVDTHTLTVLTTQGLSLEDVPEEGRAVSMKLTGNMSTGGTAIDRTDEIHPHNIEIARQAAMVVGLDVAGIDLMTPDIARSVYDQGGAIIEVNQQPGLRAHTHPTHGTPRDVGMAIVDMLFPPGRPSRVPIVAITGTNGKTTTTRMIAHIMTTAGRTVGMTTTDGMFIGGIRIAAGDLAGPSAARQVLRNPAVDCAVLETARGGLLKAGLGFDHCDVAVVTNVAADHLGDRGIETVADMAKVKAIVPRAVAPDGASVLNADDPFTVAMAAAAGGEIVYFSLDEHNRVIHDHVRQGGRAVVLHPMERGELLMLLAGEEATAILSAAEIPATMEGRIRANIANALAATAAAVAQQVPLETIRAALRTFANSVTQTPGRFNFLEIDGRRVLIDYCHNLHGLEGMADFIKRIGVAHTVAVIAMPGDRTDEHIAAFGRLAAQIFDELVIWDTPAEFRRNRGPGEVPSLLQAAAVAGGLPREKISHSDDEQVAARMAIAKGRPDGLVVMLVGSGRSLVRAERSRHLQEGLT